MSGRDVNCSHCKAIAKERDRAGRILPSSKPVATITQDGTHYYTLLMGEREMGGDNKAALAKYARSLGYKVVDNG